ncbi:hypothetical protein GGR02_000889 [Anoxybacillus voinovskiensis]|uniref:Uncharacterized protein n=1 Tax=Anoxybacteroides voinovskiense TaxID=230470 RepID=A0A840DSW5_9BACL|nr:bacteriocin biosynthesis protein AlbD [Anoxybacillus voinovskiensis]MBB4073128.1 hypothetical protein [Anoxybacillus voinovskiensis]
MEKGVHTEVITLKCMYIVGLSLLIVFEIVLIKQAHINESVLLKGYIVGALIFMNVYITLLAVNTQWKEKFMDVICILPVRARIFWTVQILFLFVDMCLRRTLFFFILPIVLFVGSNLSINGLLYWLGKFLFLTLYSIVIGIALGNLLSRKRTLHMFFHIAALLLIFCSMYSVPVLYILLCIIHMGWVTTFDFPKFLQVPPRSGKNLKSSTGFSFYKREWNRFLSSKAMILNYVVMIVFIAFFCYNLANLNMVDSTVVFLTIVALLLMCSPIALLYSIEKHNRKLLLTLPIKKWSLFLQKYAFYLGVLLIGFVSIILVLSLIFDQPISFWNITQCMELLLAGAFIRLKADEKKPNFDWETEQKLWSDFKKYRSYFYCLPLFLSSIAGAFVSILSIPIIAVIIWYVLNRQEGDFFG